MCQHGETQWLAWKLHRKKMLHKRPRNAFAKVARSCTENYTGTAIYNIINHNKKQAVITNILCFHEL